MTPTDFGFDLETPLVVPTAPNAAPSYDRVCCYDDSVDAPCWGCQSVRDREVAEILVAYERGVAERVAIEAAAAKHAKRLMFEP